MMNIYEKVTNIDVIFGNEFDGKTYDLSKLVTLPPKHDNAIFAKFDIVTGKVTLTNVNLMLAYTDGNKFADEFRRYWYYLVTESIEKTYAKFVEVEPTTENEKAAREVVRARYDNYMSFGQVVTKDICDVGETVRNFVNACYKAQDSAYSETIRNATKALVMAVKKVEIDENNEIISLKDVREKGTTLCREIFKESVTGSTLKYTFNCNHALAGDLYSVFYKRRETDKNGNVVRMYNKPVAIISECVFACMETLQAKAKEKDEPNKDSKKGTQESNKEEKK